jgi:hypothetical protein
LRGLTPFDGFPDIGAIKDSQYGHLTGVLDEVAAKQGVLDVGL